MVTVYHDRWIDCTEKYLVIRGYYFPWRGSKRISYPRIKGIRRVEMSNLRGMWRIWGTANPRYWVSWDPARPHKRSGFVLDLGGSISPLVTPDDPDAFEVVMRNRTGIEGGGQPPAKGPIV